jgi:two-component system OmpR family sensor kinase
VPGPIVVQGDVSGLRQVVTNLVSNALRYTPPIAVVEVRLIVNGDTATLDVDDSGPGMTHEEASHAFDRFWQSDPSRSRSGAGLGLSIVRSIVASHVGDVTLQSDPETGTRVRVTIPRGEATIFEPNAAWLVSSTDGDLR